MRYVGPRHIVIDDQPAPVPFWEPARWSGDVAIIVGGGPSHSAIPAEQYVRPFIAVNSACRHVRSVADGNYLLFQDNSWSERFEDLIRDWPGMVLTTNRNSKARLGAAVNRVNVLELTHFMGAPPDYVQASSGHVAACLAAFMGARRIVLIGFECQPVAGRTHGHGDYTQHDMAAFDERFLPGWQALAPAFDFLGVEVLNATPGSAIQDFPFVPFQDAIA